MHSSISPPTDELDGLLQPTSQAYGLESAETASRPWNLGSLFWIAFLGGVLPVAALSVVESKRLQSTSTEHKSVLWTCILITGLYLLSCVPLENYDFEST